MCVRYAEKKWFLFFFVLSCVKTHARMATEFVQQTVRKSLAGAAVGAGIGAGVGVLYQFSSGKKSAGQDSDAADNNGDRSRICNNYPDLYAESEIYYLVEVMMEFRHHLPEAFDSMLSGLDRLCALHTLVHSAPKEDFSASWSVTAHHHAETIRDGLRALGVVVKDSLAAAEIEERKGEIDGWVSNTVHNISMQVQTRLQDGI